jgi:hypothetical protein
MIRTAPVYEGRGRSTYLADGPFFTHEISVPEEGEGGGSRKKPRTEPTSSYGRARFVNEYMRKKKVTKAYANGKYEKAIRKMLQR